MKCGVDSVHRVSWPCTLNECVSVSKRTPQYIACDRWTSVLDRESIGTALGQFKQPTVSLLGSEMLTAFGIFASDTPEDCCLLMSFNAGQDCSEAIPGCVAGEGFWMQVQITKARIELSVCLVGEVAQVAALNADVAVNNPVNLAAAQVAHRSP